MEAQRLSEVRGESTIDLFSGAATDAAIRADIAALRESAPIVWSATHRAWLVTRYQDIRRALADELPLSSKRVGDYLFAAIPAETRQVAIPLLTRYPASWLVNLDPPEHTDRRKGLLRALRATMTREFATTVRRYCETAVQVAANEPTFDFVSRVARPVPMFTFSALLALPPHAQALFQTWAPALVLALGGRGTQEQLLHAERLLSELCVELRGLARQRVQNPGEDLISLMIREFAVSHEITDSALDDVVGQFIDLYVAGVDTTANNLSLAVATIMQDQVLYKTLRDNPTHAEQMTELMRLNPRVGVVTRIVAAPFQWYDCHLAAGDVVFLLLGSGNRDPRAFPSPDDCAPAPRSPESLTFGPGQHHCAGKSVAMLQIEEVVRAVVMHEPPLECADTQWHFAAGYRGLQTLKLRCK